MRDVAPPETLDPADFRKQMSLFATGVCVVSVDSGDDGLSAMTINSFVSVSLEPMLVCWSLHNSSSQFDAFARSQEYAVSILSDGQAELALRYAARGVSGLDETDFIRSEQNLPVIAGALAHFECRQWKSYPAGDHTMILGEVTGMSDLVHNGASAAPLVFFDGEFSSIIP